jgi:hypothetical protein
VDPSAGAFKFHNDRGLNWPLTTESLEHIGVPDSMTPRTLQAIKFLGLIDEAGQPTESFERIKRASTDEYHAQLAEVIRAAYLPVFSIVNPGQDGDVAIADAFRRYEPSNQREKMVALFRGLCMEAGIITSKPRQRGGGRKPRPEGSAKVSTGKPSSPTPPPGGRRYPKTDKTASATKRILGSTCDSSRRSSSSCRAGRSGPRHVETGGCRR